MYKLVMFYLNYNIYDIIKLADSEYIAEGSFKVTGDYC